MRLLIAALLACMVLGGGVAWAASAYDDVPRDHWAYNALDYLTERGVLEGYPDGFFKGDRTLTRYEFAQAIARLLDSVGGGGDEEIRIMAETLRAEFSDQLAELGRQMNDVVTAVNDMDARVGNLEGGLADNTSRLDALEEKVSGLNAGANWKGGFRYRLENYDQGDINRFRQRIQFYIGFNKMLNDATEFGFRLKTNTGFDPTSGNHTLSDQFRTPDIFLDRAYIKYSPSWFGYYSDCNSCEPDRDECGNCVDNCGNCEECEECTYCIPKLDIYAGIFPNITYDPNEMILDDDINMHGAGVVYHFNEDFQILTLASTAVETIGTDYFDDDAYFFACEAKYDNILFCGLDAWVGCYNWDGENLLNGVYEDNGVHNFDFNNDGVIDGNDRFTPNFHTLKGGLQYTFECTFDKPLSIYGEYMINVDSDAEDRINAVNPFVDPDIIYETTDDTGYVIGAQYGDELKYCGDWLAFARYKEVGANAVIDGFADADTFGANSNSLEVHWRYRWADNSDFGITYFLNKVNNAFGFLLPREDMSKFQIDWIFRF